MKQIEYLTWKTKSEEKRGRKSTCVQTSGLYGEGYGSVARKSLCLQR